MKEEKEYTLAEAVKEVQGIEIANEKNFSKTEKGYNKQNTNNNKFLPKTVSREKHNKLIKLLRENGDPKNMKDLVRVLTAIKEKEKEEEKEKEKEKGKGQETEEGQEPGE